MSQKSGFAVPDSDKRLIRDNAHTIREAIFGCITDTQVECSVGFARFLSRVGINAENYWLFLRLIMTNNPWVIEELVHEREPRLLFSTILPSPELVETSFQALFSRHPEEIYPKALEALLGVVENAYFDPDDGFRLRRLSIMDINALGKFLLKDEEQSHPQNCLILEILDRLTHLGEYYQEPDKNVLAKHAFNVRFAYFDNTRNLVDAIPHPLLVRVPDHLAFSPEEDFADLVSKRRARPRDERGRFVKAVEEESPLPATAEQPRQEPAPSLPEKAGGSVGATKKKPVKKADTGKVGEKAPGAKKVKTGGRKPPEG